MVTAFYVVGGVLVVLALVISFLGMKSEKFPSDNALRGGVALVAIVVAVTAVFAVRASKHEAEEREHEENVEAAELAQAENVENQQIGEEDAEDGEPDSTGVPTGDDSQAPGDRDEGDEGDEQAASGEGDPAAGMAVFTDQGCGGCHSLEAVDATGQIGPNLDVELVDKDEDYIETSIVDPSADVVEGFSDGIMPADYGEVIPPDELADLVAFLYDTTHQAAK